MECPYCGCELIEAGPYGYFAAHQSGEKIGNIFECPVARGTDDGECESDVFNGLFHDLDDGEIRDGYPC